MLKKGDLIRVCPPAYLPAGSRDYHYNLIEDLDFGVVLGPDGKHGGDWYNVYFANRMHPCKVLALPRSYLKLANKVNHA